TPSSTARSAPTSATTEGHSTGGAPPAAAVGDRPDGQAIGRSVVVVPVALALLGPTGYGLELPAGRLVHLAGLLAGASVVIVVALGLRVAEHQPEPDDGGQDHGGGSDAVLGQHVGINPFLFVARAVSVVDRNLAEDQQAHDEVGDVETEQDGAVPTAQ